MTIQELKNVRSENCISIILTTHRTKPDYLKDATQLKNLIKEVETRLITDVGEKKAAPLIKKVRALADRIDHSQNLDGLVLFVNEDISEFIRLPLKVEDRVVIDDTFATRDLIRSLHLENHYYIAVLSQDEVRLIEALNGTAIKEVGNPFPFERSQFFPRNKADAGVAARQTNLLAEFFNLADKHINEKRRNNRLPVFICGLQENYSEYMKIVDKKHSIFEVYLDKNKINDPVHDIVSESWKVVKDYIVEKNNARKQDLKKAVGENRFMSDTNEIWKAIKAGRIQTLFVEQGRFQPAIIKDDEIEYVAEARRNDTGVVDDIYDEMIEENMDFGGDVVFLPKGELERFNGFGAITRY